MLWWIPLYDYRTILGIALVLVQIPEVRMFIAVTRSRADVHSYIEAAFPLDNKLQARIQVGARPL